MFAYACPAATQRKRFIRKSDCFHHRPDWERPPVGYSPLAMRLLSDYRGQRQDDPQT